MKNTDIRVLDATVTFIPAVFRVPLKFGASTVTAVTSARARVEVETGDGRRATGWGETPIGKSSTKPPVNSPM